MTLLARAQPERPALVHCSGDHHLVLTRDDLVAYTSAFAAFLSSHVEPPYDVVAIVLRHDFRQHLVYLATIAAGCVPTFLAYPTSKQDPDRYWSAHAAIFRHVRPKAIVGYGAIADKLRPIAAEIGAALLLVEDFPAPDHPPREWPCDEVEVERVLLLQHSSGTTGARKGVALTHRQATAQVRACASAVELDETSTVVSWLPPYHDMGLFSSFLIPLSLGAAIVSMDPFEWVAKPAMLLTALEAFSGTHCWLPNFAFGHMVDAIPDGFRCDLSRVRAFVSCSEPVKSRTLERFAERFAGCGVRAEQIAVCYAMAEASFAVTQTPPGAGWRTHTYDAERLERGGRAVRLRPGAPDGRPLVSNGRPIEGFDIRVIQHGGGPAAAAEGARGLPVGEIAIRGVSVFDGYSDNPAATAEVVDQAWRRTGDIGFVDEGELYITGRAKDVIIVHGRNYYAHDIEAVVSTVAGIVPGRVAAVGMLDAPAAGEEALVIAETQGSTCPDGLRRTVRKAVHDELGLTLHRVEFVPRGWLVKTTSGKISRIANAERLHANEMSAVA